jgi:hypothetical protein
MGVIGYMLTWRTYDSWEGKGVRLSSGERRLAVSAIRAEAKALRQRVLAITVQSSHVHAVVDASVEAGYAVGRYKRAITKALRENGRDSKVWARGYDKRFCFSEEELDSRIEYVRRHEEG